MPAKPPPSALLAAILADLDRAIAEGADLRDLGKRSGLHFTAIGRYARRERTRIPVEDAAALATALGGSLIYRPAKRSGAKSGPRAH